MKKLLITALTLSMALFLVSCGGNSNAESSALKVESSKEDIVVKNDAVNETVSLSCYGFIVIEDNTIILDEVEIIESDDKERITELGLTEQNDYPSGFCIYPLDKGTVKYDLTSDTVYNFTDSGLLFADDEGGGRQYSTTSKDEFLKHLAETFYDSPPAQTVPFFVQIRDGKIVSVTEEFRFTV